MSNQTFEQTSNQIKLKTSSADSSNVNIQNLLNSLAQSPSDALNSGSQSSNSLNLNNSTKTATTNHNIETINSTTVLDDELSILLVDSTIHSTTTNCTTTNNTANSSITNSSTTNSSITNSSTTNCTTTNSSITNSTTMNEPISSQQLTDQNETSNNKQPAHSLAHCLLSTNTSTNNMPNSMTKKPSDLLDVACSVITEDNPNLFNENYSFEITHSELDVNCDLSEIVNNSILEHELIIEETDDGHNEFVENLLLNVNEHQSKYTSAKLSLTSQASAVSLVNNLENVNASSTVNGCLTGCLTGSLHSVANEENNLSNSLKKSRIKASNVHLSYLLQTKPQENLPNHQLKHLHTHRTKLTSDDNSCHNSFG